MSGTREPASGRRLALAALVGLLALAVFWPTRGFDSVTFDDPTYVFQNERVLGGLTLDGARWALTTTHFSNWHPLTWLSLMLDAELHGADPRGYHETAIWIHAINAVLLFLLLDKMTGAAGRSAFVAAVFAVHPLHVEPVAWISSRKDVLSTLFGLLSLLAWTSYVRSSRRAHYAASLALYAASLLAKQMLVTLPFLLLLLDLWPLGRIERGTWREMARSAWRRVPEKLPFLALAAAAAAAVYFAQQAGGAVRDMAHFPLAGRLANGIIVYVLYAWQSLWPVDLAAFYPYPDAIPPWQVAGAAAILVAVTLVAALEIRRRPWIAVGWLWYAGTLVPVIGLVQVGEQQMADRYTYVPLVGLAVAIAWSLGTPAPAGSARGRVLAVAATLAVALLALAARAQTMHWRDSLALFTRAAEVTERNAVAHNNLGTVYGQSGRLDEAIRHFEQALAFDPESADAHSNLGNALLQLGRLDEAEVRFREAIRLDPDLVAARMNYGIVLERTGRESEALEQYDRAVALVPEDGRVRRHAAAAHERRAASLIERGEHEAALEELREAVRLDPALESARSRLQRLGAGG